MEVLSCDFHVPICKTAVLSFFFFFFFSELSRNSAIHQALQDTAISSDLASDRAGPRRGPAPGYTQHTRAWQSSRNVAIALLSE